MKPYLTVDESGDYISMSVEWISDNYRFLIWFDKDIREHSGWAFLDKRNNYSAHGGDFSEEIIDALEDWIKWYRENRIEQDD